MKKEEVVNENIKVDYVLKDIVISALRYALGRRTYITQETAEFIMDHKELIDTRVKWVMIRDIEEYFNMRKVWEYPDDACDYETWVALYEFLKGIKSDDPYGY